MPVSERKLIREITNAKCSVKQVSGSHYLVLDPLGNTIEGFAVRHGKGVKREVKDSYVRLVRKAIKPFA